MENQRTEPKKAVAWLVLGIAVVGVAIVVAIYYFIPKNKQTQIQNIVEQIYQPPVAIASDFAKYEDMPVTVKPNVAAYTVANDFSNVVNKDDFLPNFSDAQKSLLAKNAFVVEQGYQNEFFPLYETNRYATVPNFITTDSLLHNYHMLFDYTLRKLEEDKLIPELKSLNTAMFTSALQQYEAAKGTAWENAAKRNVGFFAVGSKLMDPQTTVPSFVQNEVNQELSLIAKHEGIEASPLWGIGSAGTDKMIDTPQGLLPLDALKEDYSQYVPRGHYDKSEQLKAYFKSMMWYGRLTFRLKDPNEIRSSVLITLALNDRVSQKHWDAIYQPTAFFVGVSDDITFYQLRNLMEQAYGAQATISDVLNDTTKLATFVDLTNKLEPPKINSMPVFQASLQPDRTKEIKGFRFMGQRFTVDASIFQRLITREVGPKGEDCNKAPFSEGRMLPKGLDIPSAMGSQTAEALLKSQGEFDYACYPENMAAMKKYTSELPVETWTQNLYWGWMYSLIPLTTAKTAGYPSFMTNEAWSKKELNTYLGSWTELKHDTILYAKQSYAELGGGGDLVKKDDRGYVEPNPYLYGRLASLLKMTSDGLAERGLLSDTNKANLELMRQLAVSLKTISEKELSNTALTDDEFELIRSYGGQLEHIWLEVNRQDMEKAGTSAVDFMDQNPAAIVADVATDPNGSVLEEGTGKINTIYVVVPVDGKLRITKGTVYSYYEFPWPMNDRLTDKKWRELLGSPQAPALPEWTSSYMAK